MSRRYLALLSLLSLLGALGSVGSVAGCSRESEDCSPFPAEGFPAGTYLPGSAPLIPGATDVTLTMEAGNRTVVTFTKDGQRYRAVYALAPPYRSAYPRPAPGVITFEVRETEQTDCPTIDAIELWRDGRIIATAQKAEASRQEFGPWFCDTFSWQPEMVVGAPDGIGVGIGRNRLALKLGRGAIPLAGDVLRVYASGGAYRVTGHDFSAEGHGDGTFYMP